MQLFKLNKNKENWKCKFSENKNNGINHAAWISIGLIISQNLLGFVRCSFLWWYVWIFGIAYKLVTIEAFSMQDKSKWISTVFFFFILEKNMDHSMLWIAIKVPIK